MRQYSKTLFKRNLLLACVAVLVVAAVAAGLIAAILMEPRILDENALPGKPENLSEEIGYVSYDGGSVGKVSLACTPEFDGKTAQVLLTNPAENTALLRAEFYTVKVVYNEETGEGTFVPDRKIGATGFLRPGTYVENVKLKGLTAGVENRVMVKISSMNEESRTSNGFFYIRTTIS